MRSASGGGGSGLRRGARRRKGWGCPRALSVSMPGALPARFEDQQRRGDGHVERFDRRRHRDGDLDVRRRRRALLEAAAFAADDSASGPVASASDMDVPPRPMAAAIRVHRIVRAPPPRRRLAPAQPADGTPSPWRHAALSSRTGRHWTRRNHASCAAGSQPPAPGRRTAQRPAHPPRLRPAARRANMPDVRSTGAGPGRPRRMARAHRGDDDIAGEHRMRHAPAQRRKAPGPSMRHSQSPRR